jgi:two-component system chemotaxis response regulator CheB
VQDTRNTMIQQQQNADHKIKVMLVDDSAVIRGLLARTLEKDANIHVVSSVANGEMAYKSVKNADPDIVILDIEMPVMDGITALPLILQECPNTRVLICSTLSQKGADVSMRALELGATDCILKPSSTGELGSHATGDFQENLLHLVRALGKKDTNMSSSATQPAQPITPRPAVSSTATLEAVKIKAAAERQTASLHDDRFSYKGKPDILAIGSSTGGPQALFEVLKNLNNVDVPIVITQHMPKTFTRLLAQHISQNCGFTCVEGEAGMKLEKGHAYVAPGGFHMVFEQKADGTYIKIDDGEPENFCKPSVEPMIRSLINIYDKKVLAVILTGMGQDGRDACKMLVEKGGRTITQDEATSVVWGMPGAVANEGICSAILPLTQIGPWLKSAIMDSKVG